MTEPSSRPAIRAWTIAYWSLTIVFLVTAFMYDIVAYAVGVGTCYFAEKISLSRDRRVAATTAASVAFLMLAAFAGR
jgi:hypothetical protein